MTQFKRFNTSENGNYSTDTFPEGTLTWDPNNGLRLHDGNTYGGNSVGGSSNYYDLTNRPTGNTAVHDLQGGSSSLLNGYFLKQISTGVSEWTALPTTYDTLTIDTKIIGGIDGAAGTQITGIEASLGSGAPWRYAFLSGNDAFGNLFNRGSSIIGWKMYPVSNPGAFVTITEFLDNSLGAPSLGFSGSLGQGPWIAESSDYNAGTPGPLTLSADSANFVLGTDGSLTLPGSVTIKSNVTTNTGTGVGSMAGVTATIWTASSSDVKAAHIVYRANINYGQNVEVGTVYAVKDSAGNVNVISVNSVKSSAFTNVIILGGIDGDGKLYATASPDTSDDATFLVNVTEFY
jgi:hypothetical protein